MSDAEKKPIELPAAGGRRELIRVALEAAFELAPGGSALTKLYQVTFPPKSAQDSEAWQRAISERTNEHSARLDRHELLLAPRTETFSGTIAQLIEVMAKSCPDGLAETFIDMDDLAKFLPDTENARIVDAIQELIALGMIEDRKSIGAESVRVTQRFYEEFDYQVMTEWGSKGTRADAGFIARIILEKNNGHVPELIELTAWPLRRFNPALSHLMNAHPDWSWRDHFHSDYPSYGLNIGPQERVGLRRFIADLEREAT